MALCIMSKCRGAGFEEDGRFYIPKNVGMRREWSGVVGGRIVEMG